MSIDHEIAQLVADVVRDSLAAHAAPPAVQREALNVPEVAEACGRSEGWVYDAMKHHGMPFKRLGSAGKILVPLPGLRSWLAEQPEEPPG